MSSTDWARAGTISRPPRTSPSPLSEGSLRVPRTAPRRSTAPSTRYSGGRKSPAQVADRVLWNRRSSGTLPPKPTVPEAASSFSVPGSAR